MSIYTHIASERMGECENSTASWTLTKQLESKLRTTWRRMLRILFRAHRWRKKLTGTELEPWQDWIQRATRYIETQTKAYGLEDWVTLHKRRKWRFAGLTASRMDERWTKTILSWHPPREHGRHVGHPVTRWDDGIIAIAGGNWTDVAADCTMWRILQENYVGFE